MMKTQFAAFNFLTLLLVLFSQSSAWAFESYRFWCKAPLDYTNVDGDSSTFSFQHSPAASGPFGKAIPNGSCAWEDRPMSADEPFYLTVSVRPSANDSELIRNSGRFNSLASMFGAATVAPGTRFLFQNAYKGGAGILLLERDVMTVNRR